MEVFVSEIFVRTTVNVDGRVYRLVTTVSNPELVMVLRDGKIDSLNSSPNLLLPLQVLDAHEQLVERAYQLRASLP